MIRKLSESRRWQLFLIVGLIIVVPLTVDINGRISIIRRMRQEETRLTDAIAGAREENARLQAELEALSDPAYIEEWARVEARMTRPGEVALIPMHVNSTQSQEGLPQGAPSDADTSLSISDQWHRLFFDVPASP